MVLFLANSGLCLANNVRKLYNQCFGNSVNGDDHQANMNGASFPCHSHHGHNHLHDTCHIHHIALNDLSQNRQSNAVYHCNSNKKYCTGGEHQKYIVPNEFLTLTNTNAVVNVDGKISSGGCSVGNHSGAGTLTKCARLQPVPHCNFLHNDYHCNHHSDQINRSVACEQSIDNCASYEDSHYQLQQHQQQHPNTSRGTNTAPVIICLLLISGYIYLGAFYLYRFEQWTMLDGAYFSFLALSTIGFGGFTFDSPTLFTHNNNNANYERKLIIFGCYVLIGMVLVSMCFNLLQDKIVNRVKNCKRNQEAKHDEAYDEEEQVTDLQQAAAQLVENNDDFEA